MNSDNRANPARRENLTALRALVYLFTGSGRELGAGLPDGRDVRRYLTAALAACVPCLCAATWYYGLRVPAMFATALASGAAVEIAFAIVRKKEIWGGTPAFAGILVLLLPPQIPLWMVAVGSAFGVFFGKEVFGGTGHHVFSPVLVAKGFLMFSYPTVVHGSHFGSMIDPRFPNAWMVCGLLMLAGGAAMIAARPDNAFILLGVALAGLCTALNVDTARRLPYESIVYMLAVDGFLFGACFLACDPACSPRGRSGKWTYGVLVGSTAVIMRSFSNYSEGMMSAVLVGNLFAPTMDVLAEQRIGRGGAS
jgi:Na+-translocating ferredoxin:NAD+ oxidoreductase RnfD subunit